MHTMKAQAKQVSARIDELLCAELSVPESAEGKLIEAMRYSVLGGGKRFRAFLCCASANLFGVEKAHSVRTASAIECVHTYSLIHDDLPCMDDDDMRRAKPSLHRAYDEATAILAGDALLTLAFEILADEKTHPRKAIRLDLISGLTKAAGARGMVAGQLFDMLSHELDLDAGGLTHLQHLKTGGLIRFAVEAGAILGEANSEQRQSLIGYASNIGLAFQIADDLLDVQKSTQELGKTAGKDAVHGKVTFVSLLGEKRASEQATILIEQAIGYLSLFGDCATPLQEAAKFVIQREN